MSQTTPTWGLLALSLLFACGGKDDASAQGDSADDSSADDSAADDSAADDSGVEGDADGDGVPAEQDCDDHDASVWLADTPFVASQFGLNPTGYEELCAGYCERTLVGSLQLPNSGSTADAVQHLRCLVEVTEDVESGGHLSAEGLTGLARLERIGGDLRLEAEPYLESLAGLQALEEVGGSLYIHDAPSLRSDAGFDALREVGWIVDVRDTGWEDLTPLSALEGVGLDMSIVDNEQMTSLRGIEALREVGGTLRLGWGNRLTDLEPLRAWTTAPAADLELEGMNAVIDFDALSGLERVEGTLRLRNFRNVERIDLSSLQSVTNLRLYDMERLHTLEPMPRLTELHWLELNSLDVLPDLSGFSSLQQVHGSCDLSNLHGLTDLSGLSGLTDVGRSFSVSESEQIVSLVGADALQTVGGLSVYENPLLTELALPALAQVDDVVNIRDNPGLCDAEIDGLIARIGSAQSTFVVEDNGGECVE